MKHHNNIITTTILLALDLFALSSIAHAVSPLPDGDYPGGNTAEGQSALLSVTTGTYNTAIGYFSLLSNATNSFNTAIGAGALLASTASSNTAVGAGALLSNTSGSFNTANGVFALVSDTQGASNTAIGYNALFHNTTGTSNTATGTGALFENTTANFNTASGYDALALNVTGSGNTAYGVDALDSAVGSNNTAIVFNAGANLTTGSNNIYIGAGIEGLAGDDGVCRIGSIYGATITGGTEVFINSDNRLGTITSSKRFKQNITPTSSASEVLYELQPVRFQYEKNIDPEGRWQFGLMAEEVEKVNPNLVVRDKEGKPYSVRYDQVNAMLLNEFLKEHRRVAEQTQKVASLEKAIADQQKKNAAMLARLEEQAAQIQQINTRVRSMQTGSSLVATRP